MRHSKHQALLVWFRHHHSQTLEDTVGHLRRRAFLTWLARIAGLLLQHRLAVLLHLDPAAAGYHCRVRRFAIAHLYSVETDRRPAKADLRRARSFLPTSEGGGQEVNPTEAVSASLRATPGTGGCLLALAGVVPLCCQLLLRRSKV